MTRNGTCSSGMGCVALCRAPALLQSISRPIGRHTRQSDQLASFQLASAQQKSCFHRASWPRANGKARPFACTAMDEQCSGPETSGHEITPRSGPSLSARHAQMCQMLCFQRAQFGCQCPRHDLPMAFSTTANVTDTFSNVPDALPNVFLTRIT